MKVISKNRYIDAGLKLMLFSAACHVVILLLVAAIRTDATALNFFSIMDFEAFFPGISQGIASQVASAAIISALYGTVFFLFTGK